MNRPGSLSTRQAIEAAIEPAETDGRWATMTANSQLGRAAEISSAVPFVTWRLPNGRCCRAWIERTHGQAGARFLFSVQTDTIDGKPIGEPISAPICHDVADLETLLAYVWAHTRA